MRIDNTIEYYCKTFGSSLMACKLAELRTHSIIHVKLLYKRCAFHALKHLHYINGMYACVWKKETDPYGETVAAQPCRRNTNMNVN